MLLKLYDCWDHCGIIKRLEKMKGVYSEPRDSSHYKFVISAFYKDVYNKGAVMFAVCRGKISEGLDFSDDAARCVVLIGVPYPMVLDPTWTSASKMASPARCGTASRLLAPLTKLLAV